jgi:hypothetical protein
VENCLPAATTESYIQGTKDSLETSLAAEEKYYWVLGYGGDANKLSTRDWYLKPYSAQLVTGGLDTHTQPTHTLTEPQCVPTRIPKVDHSSDASAPLPPPQQSSRYPTRTHRPPQHLNDYLLATVAEEQTLPTERPYRTAGGTTVDLAIQDENRMAHVCHYVMIHIADSLYYADALKLKPTKNSTA